MHLVHSFGKGLAWQSQMRIESLSSIHRKAYQLHCFANSVQSTSKQLYSTETETNPSSTRSTKLLVLIGAPGSGKGTQSRYSYMSEFGKIVCAGDVLREEAFVNKNESLKQVLNSGKMAPEEITAKLLSQKLASYSTEKNDNHFIILDGYPRTETQAQFFAKWFSDSQNIYFHKESTVILHLLASRDTIMERLQGRLLHLPSGRTYNEVYAPPKIPLKDDITGEDLMRRDDDINPEAVRNRIDTYLKRTIPMMEYIESQGFKIWDIKEDTIENVAKQIRTILESKQFISEQVKQ